MPKLVITWPAADPALGVVAYQPLVKRGSVTVHDTEVATNSLEIQNPEAGVYTAAVRQRNLAGLSSYSPNATSPNVPPAPSTPTIEFVL